MFSFLNLSDSARDVIKHFGRYRNIKIVDQGIIETIFMDKVIENAESELRQKLTHCEQIIKELIDKGILEENRLYQYTYKNNKKNKQFNIKKGAVLYRVNYIKIDEILENYKQESAVDNIKLE